MLLFTRGLRQVLRARLRTGTGYRNDAKFQVRLDIRKLVRYGPIRWFAALPISIVGSNAIMFGTLLSAAEYDGWITWGHEASVVMLLPIAICAVTAWLTSSRHE